jgi:hypothetical protein
MSLFDAFKKKQAVAPMPVLSFKYPPTTGETLRQKRQRFSMMFAELILWANKQPGFVALQAETKRAPLQAEFNALGDPARREIAVMIQTRFSRAAQLLRECGDGTRKSLHIDGLAGDVDLFVNGEYQRVATQYQPLGIFWEALAPDAEWGGRFVSSPPDGPHFSIAHDGRK